MLLFCIILVSTPRSSSVSGYDASPNTQMFCSCNRTSAPIQSVLDSSTRPMQIVGR